jgi:hypothetical protein
MSVFPFAEEAEICFHLRKLQGRKKTWMAEKKSFLHFPDEK